MLSSWSSSSFTLCFRCRHRGFRWLLLFVGVGVSTLKLSIVVVANVVTFYPVAGLVQGVVEHLYLQQNDVFFFLLEAVLSPGAVVLFCVCECLLPICSRVLQSITRRYALYPVLSRPCLLCVGGGRRSAIFGWAAVIPQLPESHQKCGQRVCARRYTLVNPAFLFACPRPVAVFVRFSALRFVLRRNHTKHMENPRCCLPASTS